MVFWKMYMSLDLWVRKVFGYCKVILMGIFGRSLKEKKLREMWLVKVCFMWFYRIMIIREISYSLFLLYFGIEFSCSFFMF